MRHDLGLRRMIRRFNADNAILQVRMVVADMLGQFILADPGPTISHSLPAAGR
ncbi:hypothetical protein [Mesorhizobium sp. M7A.F.Ca.US.010.02.1.1]|uniref:hypothetical protein n=1 Tax=Mesorhizobium sp. M7A.F.Ca.US.010.02.1.1 TaxID=2496743 RepID=UPI0013E3638F|nr:hypothetical protein [Mesorhizobium sp. M7A.F.Ca.US.010.02.1.1]